MSQSFLINRHTNDYRELNSLVWSFECSQWPKYLALSFEKMSSSHSPCWDVKIIVADLHDICVFIIIFLWLSFFSQCKDVESEIMNTKFIKMIHNILEDAAMRKSFIQVSHRQKSLLFDLALPQSFAQMMYCLYRMCFPWSLVLPMMQYCRAWHGSSWNEWMNFCRCRTLKRWVIYFCCTVAALFTRGLWVLHPWW